MDDKIPKDIIEELDITNNSEDKNDFEVTAIVETHQIKLPLPKKLIYYFFNNFLNFTIIIFFRSPLLFV